jgi:two-component system OmpR family response regulator
LSNQRIAAASRLPLADIFEGSAPRVLIIDDDHNAADALSRALSEPSKRSQELLVEVAVVDDPASVDPFLERDSIDIYIVDLKLKENKIADEDKELGAALVRKIAESSSAGIIVFSSLPAEIQSAESLLEGADDYITKGTSKEIIKSRVLSLWRRIRRTRPSTSNLYAHTNRTFLIGGWRFVIGSRELVSKVGGRIRISSIEHAFLSHLAMIEGHEIDRDHFNVYVLGRETYHNDRRIDNLVSRLRAKLGDSVQIIANRKDGYKLLNVEEVRPPT